VIFVNSNRESKNNPKFDLTWILILYDSFIIITVYLTFII
jgi:hypothetical protein